MIFISRKNIKLDKFIGSQCIYIILERNVAVQELLLIFLKINTVIYTLLDFSHSFMTISYSSIQQSHHLLSLHTGGKNQKAPPHQLCHQTIKNVKLKVLIVET